MKATKGSKRNQKRLCYNSDTYDGSFLFRTSNDLMTSILSYLDIKSICYIDIAVSNNADRIMWLTYLSANNQATFSNHEHCKHSIRWLVKRKIRLESFTVKDKRCREPDKIDGSTLVGLDISSLRYISLNGCNIGDEEISWLANGCPHLSGICLSGCNGVTDASLMALGRYCRHLISIDIKECKNITDRGLEGCPSISNIDLSHCEKITDVGIGFK